jgi:hypothetical protein
MKEGAWINTRSGKFWWVQEHCMFAKDPKSQDEMGLPPKVREEIAPFTCDFNGPDRENVLLHVMRAGYIRFRGHGSQYTFEFWGPSVDNLWACYMFAKEYAGPFTYIVINNLKSKETVSMTFQEFEKRMQEDERSVLRVAKKLLATEHRVPEGF